MTTDDFDDFLQEACLAVHDKWCHAGGRELTAEELQQLNDLLTQFFGCIRE